MQSAISIYGRYIDTITGVFYFFAGALLVVELLWLAYRRRLNKPRVLEMLASYSPFIPAVVVDALTVTALIALYYAVYSISPWEIPVTAWSTLLAVILVDFVYYWEHRWAHEIRVLWALYHSVHHSSSDFNLGTAFRVSFVDQFFSPLFYLPLVALGFHPALILSGLVFILAYQTWIHTEMIGKLGWLEKIFNTPSHHRVHHGSDPKYLDRNYAAVLIVWDRLFRTYQVEEERPVYGLTEPLNSVNPFKVHFHEAVKLVRDLSGARSAREVCGYLFRLPGWTPLTKDRGVLALHSHYSGSHSSTKGGNR